MSRRATVLILLSLVAILAVSGCRSRKTVPPPATTPPVITEAPAPETAVPVPSPDTDFPAPPADPDVLSEDINEANRVAHERGWIRDAFFAYDASTLDADAQEALQQSATWLRAHPEYRVRVEGHCDDRGTEQYNLALGDRRADTAASYLATLGLDRTRIETVSYGEERPFEEGDSEADRAQNRRAHLVLVKR
ncbi:MAG TPA: OmpA family protein [Thermoanaerobaculia bacterium]|jgi:peptidoglycan-associated lipoprotein|nr:OmpA family protein [Thermoanaerobaculia bacterium]